MLKCGKLMSRFKRRSEQQQIQGQRKGRIMRKKMEQGNDPPFHSRFDAGEKSLFLCISDKKTWDFAKTLLFDKILLPL